MDPTFISTSTEGLPPLLRERLESMGSHRPRIVDRRVSADGSRKYVLELHDGELVEAVGIPNGNLDDPESLTVCFSSQVGCAMGCSFCLTGRQGLTRNLDAAEMLWQIALVSRDFGQRPHKVLAMGQGEPLANGTAVIEALGVLGSPEGLALDPWHLMVSTCGLTEGIRALAASPVAVMLNVSLHAARQELRDDLMPGLRGQPLALLHAELARYNALTGRPVALQYLLLEGVNDSDKDLRAVREFCEGLDALVVLLHFNDVEGIAYRASKPVTMAFWSMRLNQDGVKTYINHTRGTDIDAACGQLRNRVARS